jgi:glyoxylase-like metal-dependent hydrolase (beta-lactamase superfamily II)
MGLLIGPEGTLLVDDQFAPLAPAILEAVRELSGEAPRFVVNTHVHPDHIGSNEVLAEAGAMILAHDNVRLRMLTELRIPRRGGINFPQPPERARPILTFDNQITFHLNGEEIRIFLAPPAHTDGDSFVHFVTSDVLHLGDVFRTNMYPIVDVHNGGSYGGMIDAIDLAIEICGPETRIIPGHGAGLSDCEGLLEVREMMLDIRGRVVRMLVQGSTLEEVLAAGVTAEYDEKWGQEASWTAADLIPIIYEEYRRPL